ncbi:MAG: hypothetical protein S4CHLAM45_15400 [Chlamydiales bacterium]|nr:hypothetical protein [Chlamydiales bacterium]MCH9620157.1 hypothetical protein [Chlamydiales bacterium]MCH9623627.1 hypothetical protein [Chlamydiales bacterium]
MRILNAIAWILVLIGGITWGTVGFFDWNFIDFFLSRFLVDRIVYDAIGVSSIFLIFRAKKFFCSSSSCKKD